MEIEKDNSSVPCVQIVIPPDANLNQFCAAVIAAMEKEHAKTLVSKG